MLLEQFLGDRVPVLIKKKKKALLSYYSLKYANEYAEMHYANIADFILGND